MNPCVSNHGFMPFLYLHLFHPLQFPTPELHDNLAHLLMHKLSAIRCNYSEIICNAFHLSYKSFKRPISLSLPCQLARVYGYSSLL